MSSTQGDTRYEAGAAIPHDACMTNAGATDPTVTPPYPPYRPYKLMRARKGRMLAGVAAGLAKASGLDVTVVRICIGASMLGGLGVIGYVLLWIVLPDESPVRGRVIEPAPENTARVIRISLVVAALLGVLNRVGDPLALPGGQRPHQLWLRRDPRPDPSEHRCRRPVQSSSAGSQLVGGAATPHERSPDYPSAGR